jgi:LmbE family N-acetylglucosaminyl deacetylase
LKSKRIMLAVSVLTLAAISGSLVASPVLAGPPRTAAALGDCSADGRRALNIVAHHDDDLLFLFPSIAGDIRSGHCVLTVYLVASDYQDAAERETYVLARETGLRAAYAATAGKALGDWAASMVTLNGREIPRFTLGDKVTTLELRLPDNGSAYASALGDVRSGSLRRLYSRGANLHDFYGTSTYSRASLTSTLTAIIRAFRPTVIRTMDPSAALHGGTDYIDYHWDHVTVGKLVGDAAASLARPVPVHYYRDYVNRYAHQNLSDARAADKLTTFRTFAAYDSDICPDGAGPDCVTSGFYFTLTHNQYRARRASLLPFVPASSAHSSTIVRPRFAGQRLWDPATDLCLVVPGGRRSDDLADGEPVRLAACSATTRAERKNDLRRFTLVGGYLKADATNTCLVPATIPAVPGTRLVDRQCVGPALRWAWDSATGGLRHRASGLALTVVRDAVVLRRGVGSDFQPR